MLQTPLNYSVLLLYNGPELTQRSFKEFSKIYTLLEKRGTAYLQNSEESQNSIMTLFAVLVLFEQNFSEVTIHER